MTHLTTGFVQRLWAPILMALFTAAPLFAQTASPSSMPSSPSRPFGLDPYKPSDAKILRELGPALVTRMPVDELSKLDPYNPTDAALLRQRGGSIPICCLDLLAPIGPFGAGAFTPRLGGVPRMMRAPRRDANTVWICRGTACATADARTHQYSQTPADPDALAPR